MSTPISGREELRTHRQQLQLLADRLSGRVSQLATEATLPTGTDEAAVAGTEGDEEVARGVLASEQQILAEVRDALARFDAGTFGRCERCGRAIAKSRLDAVPYARLCAGCARAADEAPR